MDNLCPLHAFPLIKTKDKLRRTQPRGKKTLRFLLQHFLQPPFPSKIQLAKNKWACHHRSENSFGLEPVFMGLYASAFTKNFDLGTEKALKSPCDGLAYHR